MRGTVQRLYRSIAVHLFLCTGIPLASLQAAEQASTWMTQEQNISCALIEQVLRCDVAKPSWKLWGCQNNGCIGRSFVLPAKGKAYLIRSSDTTWMANATVFSRDSITKIGAISCRATTDQLSCTNRSGGRLSLSNTRYSLNR